MCYWKTKPQPVFPGTAAQLQQLDVHRRALEAWRSISDGEKVQWSEYAMEVPAHRPPFNENNRISGYNLFVSAYHGLARLGCERIPEPKPFVSFSPFAISVISSCVEDSAMRIVCGLDMPGEVNPEKFRLLSRIQLVKPGRGFNPGKMRNFLAEELGADENGRRLVKFTIPDYVNVFGLDLEEYTVHFQSVLIDERTGYRGSADISGWRRRSTIKGRDSEHEELDIAHTPEL